MSRLTDIHRRQARVLRSKAFGWDYIIEHFHGRYTREEVEQSLRELKEKGRRYYDNHYLRGKRVVPEVVVTIVPNEVLEHRDQRVMLRPKSLTALVCGDPLPGESALDRKSVA